jgi:Lon protease-like protein
LPDNALLPQQTLELKRFTPFYQAMGSSPFGQQFFLNFKQ